MDRRFFCGAPQAGEPFAGLRALLTNDDCDALAVMTTGWTRRLEAVLYRADEAAASAEALHTVSLLLIVVLAATNMLTLPLLALLGLVGACGIVTYSVTTPALVPALVKAEEYSWAQRADRIGSQRRGPQSTDFLKVRSLRQTRYGSKPECKTLKCRIRIATRSRLL